MAVTASGAPRFTARQAATLCRKAAEAAAKAAKAAKPAPMVVGTPVNMFASLVGGDDGGFRTDRPIDVVSEGVCGRAWVWFPKASDSFGRRALAAGATSKAYQGGMVFRPRVAGQSMERYEAAAQAAAAVFRAAGVECWVESRMD
jgi:hypothetical protein